METGFFRATVIESKRDSDATTAEATQGSLFVVVGGQDDVECEKYDLILKACSVKKGLGNLWNVWTARSWGIQEMQVTVNTNVFKGIVQFGDSEKLMPDDICMCLNKIPRNDANDGTDLRETVELVQQERLCSSRNMKLSMKSRVLKDMASFVDSIMIMELSDAHFYLLFHKVCGKLMKVALPVWRNFWEKSSILCD